MEISNSITDLFHVIIFQKSQQLLQVFSLTDILGKCKLFLAFPTRKRTSVSRQKTAATPHTVILRGIIICSDVAELTNIHASRRRKIQKFKRSNSYQQQTRCLLAQRAIRFGGSLWVTPILMERQSWESCFYFCNFHCAYELECTHLFFFAKEWHDRHKANSIIFVLMPTLQLFCPTSFSVLICIFPQFTPFFSMHYSVSVGILLRENKLPANTRIFVIKIQKNKKILFPWIFGRLLRFWR